MAVLECSSKGDKRFSAFYAQVDVNGKMDSIENHYQLSKRFWVDGMEFVPKVWKDAKGKTPDHFEVGGKSLPVNLLSQWYTMLWAKYLDNHPELVEYAKTFDDFNDTFKGKSVNCQADVIRKYVKEGRDAVLNSCAEFKKALRDVPPSAEPVSTTEGQVLSVTSGQFEFKGQYPVVHVTGHRPQSLWGFDRHPGYKAIYMRLYELCKYMIENCGTREFASGMALGVDCIFFDVAVALREEYQDKYKLVVHAAVPFRDQPNAWEKSNPQAYINYFARLQLADHIHYVDEYHGYNRVKSVAPGRYNVSKLQIRNEYMVDVCDATIAVWNGADKGGTTNCVNYAKKKAKLILQIHPFELNLE